MMMEKRATAAAATALCFVILALRCCVEAQVPIPAQIDGFVYKGAAPVWGKSVLVEAFFDPLCPDSRDSWRALKVALHYYSHRVSFVVHPFALPMAFFGGEWQTHPFAKVYHSNSFIASRALHIANKLNSSSTFPLLELFFKFQGKYYNKPTYDLTRASIVEDIARLATVAVGKNSHASFLAGFNSTETDSATRISFKHGCSRAVTGTPYYFVNGMPLSVSDSLTEYKTWRKIIDPLLPKEI